MQRMPQTLWVVAMSYVVGILIALPVGIYSAYRQYSVFDQAGTFVTMVGYSVPPFFSGVLVIVIFSVQLGWLPSIYDTTLKVVDWATFKQQLAQMVMRSTGHSSRVRSKAGLLQRRPTTTPHRRQGSRRHSRLPCENVQVQTS